MKSIHPFPARMAPETISDWLKELPSNSTVLDPMCGSGVVVRQSLLAGHKALGVDSDPLAVLMSRVWTNKKKLPQIESLARDTVRQASRLRSRSPALPWIDQCKETKDFVSYWFGPEQAGDLRRISYVLHKRAADRSQAQNHLLWLALSRTIITKQSGATLAWDVSHSRPHKVRTTNPFDVCDGFLRAVSAVKKILGEETLPRDGTIYRGDARRLGYIKGRRVDAVFFSPPYLNAIDYLRGHKFSLIWMGHSIPALRALRARNVGAERAPERGRKQPADYAKFLRDVLPETEALPIRYQRIIMRYVEDASLLLKQSRRVLRSNGRLGLVLGDSHVRGLFVENSRIFDTLARESGFKKIDESKRQIETTKRYLPIVSKNNSLEKRMKQEVLQIYSACPQ